MFLKKQSGELLPGQLNDISYNGVAIRLETPQSLDLNMGDKVPFLTLHLNETITCEMEVKRISTTLGNIIISGHLEEISPAQQREIQKFITRQEREKRRNEAN